MLASGYGTYAYAIAWINVLLIPSVLGMDRLLIRYVSLYNNNQQWDLLRGLVRRSSQIVLAASCTLASIFSLTIFLTAKDTIDTTAETLLTSTLLLFPFALTRVRQAILQGLHKVVTGLVPEMLLQPLLILAGVATFSLILDYDLTPTRAIMINVSSASVAFLIGAILLTRNLPPQMRMIQPSFDTQEWTKRAAYFVLISGTVAINSQTDIIMLGLLRTKAEVGIYMVSNRLAGLITFIVYAANNALSPIVARLYADNQLRQLQRVLVLSAAGTLAVALPAALIMTLFGGPLLAIFGQQFVDGRTSLTILAVAQLFNVMSGSAGVALAMTGHERDAAISIGLGALTNIILNLVLIPLYGINGAAAATAISMIFWNALLVRRARHLMGISTTVFGIWEKP